TTRDSSSTYEATRSRCSAETSGPIWVSSSRGSPTRSPATAGSSSSRKRSSTPRWTRIRERAQQSWPALSKTANGAAAAAFSRSASANTMLADLPPSSSVTRLMVAAARSAIRRPTADVQHALGQAGLERDPLELERGERGELRWLEHDRVARGERGGDLPAGDREREVPGDDQPDHPERLAEGHVHAALDGDRLAEQPLGCPRVVAEGGDDRRDLAARVRGDRLADVPRLEAGELLEASLDRVGDPQQEAGSVGGRDSPPGGEGRNRPRDGRVRLRDAGLRDSGEDLARRRLDDVQQRLPARRHLHTSAFERTVLKGSKVSPYQPRG